MCEETTGRPLTKRSKGLLNLKAAIQKARVTLKITWCQAAFNIPPDLPFVSLVTSLKSPSLKQRHMDEFSLFPWGAWANFNCQSTAVSDHIVN